ncbi:MAG: response regulator [Polyangiaceae bacterium]
MTSLERLRQRAWELLQQKRGDETVEQRAERLVEETVVLQTELSIQQDELAESHRRLEALQLHYQRLFESAPVGFVRISRTQRIEDINDAGRRLLGIESGWRREDALPFSAFFPASALAIWSSLTRGEGGRARTEILGPQGRITVDIRTVAWSDENGGWLAVIEDVSEISAARARQKEAEERLGSVVRQMWDGLVVVDAKTGLIEEHNDAFAAMLGRDGQSLVGRPHEQFFAARHRAIQQTLLRQVVDEERRHARAYYETVDGEERTADVTIGLTQSAGREVEYLIVRDVTERLRAEEEHRAVETRLAEMQKLEALGLLAAGVAHDMNNMLTAVLAATEVPATEETLSDLRAAALRGRELTERLLAVSRRKPLRNESFDLLAVADEVVSLSRRTFRREITIELARPEGAWMVHGDSGQWHQALLNLLINARDAIRGSGHVRVSAEEESSGARILTVKDDGVGMTPEVLRRAFEPFFTTKSAERGTGLGLAHVRAVVSAHGGTTKIESTPGVGTTVILGIRAVPGAATAPPAERVRLPTYTGPARTVLVVDDEPSVSRATARLLGRLGCTAVAVGSVAEAISALEQRSFDVVLTDQSMPGQTGAQLSRAIRCRWPETPVVVMTGLADDHDLKELSASGASAVLNKPFRSDELRDTLSKLERPREDPRIGACELPESVCSCRPTCHRA